MAVKFFFANANEGVLSFFHSIGPTFLSKGKEIRRWSKRTSKDSRKLKKAWEFKPVVRKGRTVFVRIIAWKGMTTFVWFAWEFRHCILWQQQQVACLTKDSCKYSGVGSVLFPEKMVFFSILGFLLEWTGNEWHDDRLIPLTSGRNMLRGNT